MLEDLIFEEVLLRRIYIALEQKRFLAMERIAKQITTNKDLAEALMVTDPEDVDIRTKQLDDNYVVVTFSGLIAYGEYGPKEKIEEEARAVLNEYAEALRKDPDYKRIVQKMKELELQIREKEKQINELVEQEFLSE